MINNSYLNNSSFNKMHTSSSVNLTNKRIFFLIKSTNIPKKIKTSAFKVSVKANLSVSTPTSTLKTSMFKTFWNKFTSWTWKSSFSRKNSPSLKTMPSGESSIVPKNHSSKTSLSPLKNIKIWKSIWTHNNNNLLQTISDLLICKMPFWNNTNTLKVKLLQWERKRKISTQAAKISRPKIPSKSLSTLPNLKSSPNKKNSKRKEISLLPVNTMPWSLKAKKNSPKTSMKSPKSDKTKSLKRKWKSKKLPPFKPSNLKSYLFSLT